MELCKLWLTLTSNSSFTTSLTSDTVARTRVCNTRDFRRREFYHTCKVVCEKLGLHCYRLKQNRQLCCEIVSFESLNCPNDVLCNELALILYSHSIFPVNVCLYGNRAEIIQKSTMRNNMRPNVSYQFYIIINDSNCVSKWDRVICNMKR